jgi:hypothetical protein
VKKALEIGGAGDIIKLKSDNVSPKIKFTVATPRFKLFPHTINSQEIVQLRLKRLGFTFFAAHLRARLFSCSCYAARATDFGMSSKSKCLTVKSPTLLDPWKCLLDFAYFADQAWVFLGPFLKVFFATEEVYHWTTSFCSRSYLTMGTPNHNLGM